MSAFTFSIDAPDLVIPSSLQVAVLPVKAIGLDDRFEQLERVDDGGNAIIYRCYDTDRQQWVALKRLHPDQNRSDDWERFVREPRLTALIDHPAVPKIYEIFPERLLKPYFTMEWLPGVNLCRVLHGLRQHREEVEISFPLESLLDVVLQVSAGVTAAHKQGIIHRDIKPENIMITRDRQVKLVDWGVAKSLAQQEVCASQRSVDGDRRVDRRLTQAGQRPGTPLYMSPEQVRQDDGIDQRTDVYSLGAVLYDCLAMTTLISGQDIREVFHQTLHGPQELPSQRGMREFVPSAAEQVCMKAVSIDPNDRYSTVDEFSSDLFESLRTF